MQLPNYAERANSARLVKLLCKGRCSQVVWAEMSVDYPGQDELRKSQVGDFTAVSQMRKNCPRPLQLVSTLRSARDRLFTNRTGRMRQSKPHVRKAERGGAQYQMKRGCPECKLANSCLHPSELLLSW
jgi:hypothetical protein